jgi:hypothetical protein
MRQFETQQKMELSAGIPFNTSSTNTSTISIENTSSICNYTHHILTNKLPILINHPHKHHVSNLPKFWSVVHRINDTTTERTTYNIDDVTYDELLTNHNATKKKRDVVDASIPCYLCKASGLSTDVFSNMVDLKLINPNDTGIWYSNFRKCVHEDQIISLIY